MSSERNKNIFTKFYDPSFTSTATEEKPGRKTTETPTQIQVEFKRYTHQDAVNFADSTHRSKQLTDRSNPKLPSGKEYSIKEFPSETGVRAYYRVVLKKADSYVLAACHVNVHGHHRADLRFIEVNDRTITRGSEKFSVVGKLYLGDTVAVKELVKIRQPFTMDVFQTTPDQQCSWMAAIITVLSRNILNNITLSILNPTDDTAVVKEQNELMTFPAGLPLKFEQLYLGNAFVPEKHTTHYCEDHHPEHRNQLLALCSKIHQPPNPLGTIFEVFNSPALTEHFDIGTDAYKKASKYSTPPSEIVETCVLMGYAAANAVSYGRLDIRAFPIQNAKRMGRMLHFFIDNPSEKPTEGKWTVGNRVQIDGATGESPAVIETVLAVKQSLKITVRLSKEVPNHVKFNNGLYILSQREPLDMQIIKSGFINELPDGSNGRKILMALYGGTQLPKYAVYGDSYLYPAPEPIRLNAYQAEYVEMLRNRTHYPIIVGSSPFGCGKSMTIVTAALEVSKTVKQFQRQLLITQSNFASVNLVDIASKIKGFNFVRYISEKNAKELADDCLTDYDLPVLSKKIYTEWALGYHQGKIMDKHKFNILNHVLNKNLVQPDELMGEARVAYTRLNKRGASAYGLLDAFFVLYNPSVIMSTADSLQTLLSYNILTKDSIATIQIDEASQLPEYTFISLLTLFPNANYGLIGDIQQLPPYCETGLEGKLKDFGIGNTMERAVAGKIFPQAMLREVYRCHPKTTGLLSDLFYDGKLIAGTPENKRTKFMLNRPDFWPNPNFPVMVVNNRGKTQRMGTSCGNTDEKAIVQQLLDSLTTNYNGYKLRESDIGVISFYKAQTSVLTDALRGLDVKCGTVDAFQGSEKEVVILCCTNQAISEFMQLSNRLNVAMSRAKQVTIIVGNVAGLKKAKYWGTIVERAEKNGCVVEAGNIGKIPPNSRPAYRETPFVQPPAPARPQTMAYGSPKTSSYSSYGYSDSRDSLSRRMSGLSVNSGRSTNNYSSAYNYGYPARDWKRETYDANSSQGTYARPAPAEEPKSLFQRVLGFFGF